MMFRTFFLVFNFLIFCSTANAESLLEARSGFKTKIIKQVREPMYTLDPPTGTVSLIQYQTEIGSMSAYISAEPKGSEKLPAIIWITGGFPAGGIGEYAWEASPKSNDQSAKVYREKGIVMMYPSFRGADGNIGVQEGFYGEVNDVLSALEYVKQLDYVDNNNIYLGGHSTGGTLALLVAQATDEFKAVFAFGPVSAPIDYGIELVLHDPNDKMEILVRAPVVFMNGINSHTYVIEGSGGNISALQELERYSQNDYVKFFEIKKSGHFDLLHPINEAIADKILNSLDSPLILTKKEVQAAFDQ